MQNLIDALFSLKEATASLRLRVLYQVLLDLHRVDEVKNFAANNLLQVGRLVTYQDLCNKKGGVHVLKSSEVLKRQKVSIVCLSTGIVESRDKGFILDLKLLFTIVDCFSGRFPPRFITVKLVCFIGFPLSSSLVLFTIHLCMILT